MTPLEIVSRAWHAEERGDIDSLADLYAPDATWAIDELVVEGREAIVAMYRANLMKSSVRSIAHLASIQAGNDLAVQWTAEAVGEDGSTTVVQGTNFVHTDGQRIRSLRAYMSAASLQNEQLRGPVP
jgi:uncharacterized protein (TIGR02246 family)